MEKIVKTEQLQRKLRHARCNKKHIKVIYYNIVLFILDLIDDINKIFTGFNYKGEWEVQNIQLDNQKKRITELEKNIKSMEGIIESKDEEINKQKEEIKKLKRKIRGMKNKK